MASPYKFLAIVTAVTGILVLIIMIALGYSGMTVQSESYAIAIDAGSSHSGIFLYTWEKKVEGTGIVSQVFTNRTHPGISDFANNPEMAGESILNLLEMAKNHIPHDLISVTPVYLAATAGMRVLQQENSAGVKQILDAIKDAVRASGFLFNDPDTQVRVLPGSDEALYGWATVNYLGGTLGKYIEGDSILDMFNSSRGYDTVGALDLGGASTQLTFRTNQTLTEKYEGDIQLFGAGYNLYAYSFLCYGVNEALRRYRAQLVVNSGFQNETSDPCGLMNTYRTVKASELFGPYCTKSWPPMQTDPPANQTEYRMVGAWNKSLCTDAVKNLTATINFCIGCGTNGSSDVASPSRNRFLAFSAYYYRLEDLGLVPPGAKGATVSQADYHSHWLGFCDNSTSGDPQNVTDSRADCFAARYAQSLLENAYGFNTAEWWSNIYFSNSVNGFSTGWTLGFVLDVTMGIPFEESFVTTVHRGSAAYVIPILLGVGLLLTAVILAVCHWRKGEGR